MHHRVPKMAKDPYYSDGQVPGHSVEKGTFIKSNKLLNWKINKYFNPSVGTSYSSKSGNEHTNVESLCPQNIDNDDNSSIESMNIEIYPSESVLLHIEKPLNKNSEKKRKKKEDIAKVMPKRSSIPEKNKKDISIVTQRKDKNSVKEIIGNKFEKSEVKKIFHLKRKHNKQEQKISFGNIEDKNTSLHSSSFENGKKTESIRSKEAKEENPYILKKPRIDSKINSLTSKQKLLKKQTLHIANAMENKGTSSNSSSLENRKTEAVSLDKIKKGNHSIPKKKSNDFKKSFVTSKQKLENYKIPHISNKESDKKESSVRKESISNGKPTVINLSDCKTSHIIDTMEAKDASLDSSNLEISKKGEVTCLDKIKKLKHSLPKKGNNSSELSNLTSEQKFKKYEIPYLSSKELDKKQSSVKEESISEEKHCPVKLTFSKLKPCLVKRNSAESISRKSSGYRVRFTVPTSQEKNDCDRIAHLGNSEHDAAFPSNSRKIIDGKETANYKHNTFKCNLQDNNIEKNSTTMTSHVDSEALPSLKKNDVDDKMLKIKVEKPIKDIKQSSGYTFNSTESSQENTNSHRNAYGKTEQVPVFYSAAHNRTLNADYQQYDLQNKNSEEYSQTMSSHKDSSCRDNCIDYKILSNEIEKPIDTHKKGAECVIKSSEMEVLQKATNCDSTYIGTENNPALFSENHKRTVNEETVVTFHDRNSEEYSSMMPSHEDLINLHAQMHDKFATNKAQEPVVSQKEIAEYAHSISQHDCHNENSKHLCVDFSSDNDFVRLNSEIKSSPNYLFKLPINEVLPSFNGNNIKAKSIMQPQTSMPLKSNGFRNSLEMCQNFEDYYHELIRIIVEFNFKLLYEREPYQEPPAEVSKGASPLPLHFDTFMIYVSSFFPMIILEIWEDIHLLTKHISSCNSSNSFFFSVLSYELVNGLILLKCESVINRDNFFLPSNNSIVILDLNQGEDGNEFSFGFIISCKKHVLEIDSLSTPEWQYLPSEKLRNADRWTFDVYIKFQQSGILINKLMEGLGVCSVGDKIQQIEALNCLRRSPLLLDILTPTLNTFSVPQPLDICSTATAFDMISVHKNICNTVLNVMQLPPSLPKILLLQGPPGSGKTRAIPFLVQNLLSNCSSNMKILINAPSDLAVDEIGCQLDFMIKRTSSRNIKLIHLGNTQNIHPKLVPYSMEKYLEKQREKYETKFNSWQSELSDQKKTLLSKQTAGEEKNELLKIKTEYERIKREKVKKWDSSLELSEMKKILNDKNVVLSTLEDCFKLNKCNVEFSCCIIDESNQTTEMKILFPFALGINKFVLIGDHMQLPANVRSNIALNCGYERSMFERFWLYFTNKYQKQPGIILSNQFRMHSEILYFPLKHFYVQHPFMSTGADRRSNSFPLVPYMVFHDRSDFCFEELPPFTFRGVHYIISLCKFILKIRSSASIGIIVPSIEIRDLYCSSALKNLPQINIEIDLIDNFQGREKSVIIFSCYANNNTRETVTEYYSKRRVNVALTRAVSSLVICGPLHHLTSSPVWEDIISDAISRNRYVTHTYHDDFEMLFKHYMLKEM